MLARVRGEVESRLQDSLQGTALIELGLEERPEAVPNRWGQLIQETARTELVPLPTRKIVEHFDALDGELLILGAPGGGKTTTLLDLARTLIARAEEQDDLPIPVVFHLASWAVKRPPFAEWLIGELADKYDVPRKLARTWVASDQILSLLDGLDEVPGDERMACVDAINTYCRSREQELVSLVVCSRTADYEALGRRLQLRGAILLQPLSPAQIDEQLASAGQQLVGLRNALQADGAWRELAATPLLLNLMMLTYQGASDEVVASQGTTEERRAHLLTAYVERMFTRRGLGSGYGRRETIRWLSWLARALNAHGQSTLYVDRLQPNWLSGRTPRLAYGLIDRVGWGLIIGLVLGLAFWATFDSIDFGLAGWLMGWSMAALFGGKPNRPFVSVGVLRQLADFFVHAIQGIIIGLAWGLAIGVTTTLTRGLADGLVSTFVFGLAGGQAFGLLSVLSGGLSWGLRRIEPVEAFRWSFGRAFQVAAMGLLAGFSFGVVSIGFVAWVTVGLDVYLASWPAALTVGLGFGLVVGLIFGLVGGLVGNQIEDRVVPNQGIYRSARRSIVVGLVAALITGSALMLFGLTTRVDISDRVHFSLTYGVAAGLIFGLAVGLPNGGFACLAHFALRVVLWRRGMIPLRYVHFLHYATERIFLQRVGGGFAFVHRLVQEHFATHEQELIARVCGRTAVEAASRSPAEAPG